MRVSSVPAPHASGMPDKKSVEHEPDAKGQVDLGEETTKPCSFLRPRRRQHPRSRSRQIPLLPTRRELARVGALTAVNNFPLFVFAPGSADTDPMPVASHRASGRLHAVLRQSRNGPA
jgi:hypothetical protein